MKVRHAVMALAAGVVALSAGRSATGQVAFQPIEAVGGPFPVSYAEDISADGRVVVGSTTTADGFRAFRWSVGRGVELLDPAAVDDGSVPLTWAAATSADGSVIVALGGDMSFIWTRQHGAAPIGPAPVGSVRTIVRDVSDDGQIAVGAVDFGSHSTPFRWTAATGLQLLEPLPLDYAGGQAHAISGDGSVIVGSLYVLDDPLAFTWRAGIGYTHLPSIHVWGPESNAYDTSYDGSIVVGNADRSINPVAARWSGSGIHLIGDLPGSLEAGGAYAVSADGSVIGGSSFAAVGGGGFIWFEGDANVRSMTAFLTDHGIDLQGRVIVTVRGISADGQVVTGYSFRADGLHEAYVARIGPLAACPCNFDDSTAAVDERDVLAFIDAWFAGEAAADFNNDQRFDIHDILQFLDCWFYVTATGPCSTAPGTGGSP